MCPVFGAGIFEVVPNPSNVTRRKWKCPEATPFAWLRFGLDDTVVMAASYPFRA